MSTIAERDVNDGSESKPVQGKEKRANTSAEPTGEGVLTPMDSGTPGPRGPEPVQVPKKKN
jgi:hypothetical protein